MLSVQTNMSAITALKHLNTNTINMNKSLERLSSGFRINSAADDAAGYAISTKLAAQRSGLEVATQNAMQATAMVKMADAAINEIQNMVTRMQALATQAASGNLTDADRAKLEAERAKLAAQIDSIATSTNYNGVHLLDGTAGVSVATNTIASTQGVSKVTLNGAAASTTFTVTYVDNTPGNATTNFSAGDAIQITDGTTTQSVTVATLPTGTNTADVVFDQLGITLTINSSINGQSTAAPAGTITTSAAAVSDIQVGADNTADNRVSVDLTKSFKTADLNANFATGDITTQSNAQAYITYAQAALDTLAANRAALGATQNQLGYVTANLATAVEQVSASISTIKDANMATEMANFTKSQILVQAGTAMLAQANQTAKNVLTLFR